MTTPLEEKEEHFRYINLLDISDDETGFPDQGFLKTQQLQKEFEQVPQRLYRKSTNFLGLTPKERKAEFKKRSREKRAATRTTPQGLTQAETAPMLDVASSFPPATPDEPERKGKLKRNVSLPELVPTEGPAQIPFYRIGDLPRELKNSRNGKIIKLAENPKLAPEHRRALKGCVIYFIPNDDISMARRQRIHKVIEYGAAWVKTWRADITHGVVDDAMEYDYAKVLQHLKRANIPSGVTLVPYDPYVPECIQYQKLVDTAPTRFRIKGAPRTSISEPRSQEIEPFPSQSLQGSLQVKKSMRELKAQNSQETDAPSWRNASPQSRSPIPSNDRVEDSFVNVPDPPAAVREPSLEPRQPAPVYSDELSAAIETMKTVSHLPLDDDEQSFDSSRRSSGQEQDFGNETEKDIPKPKKVTKYKKFEPPSGPRGKKPGFNQHTFQCMDPRGMNDLMAGNPNAQTIKVLEELCKYYDQMGDNWRTLAYRRAIGSLRKQTSRICTREQAAALPYVGSSLAEKIEEIVLTNRLRKLDNANADPRDEVLRLFLGIYDVGLSQAHKWLQAGHRTLDDLIKSPNVKLTPNQKVGIERYQDFQTRIPREEVEKHGEVVRQALRKIDRGFEVTVMGSYRRGANDSGDIDLIITKPKTPLSTMRTLVFSTLIPKLVRHGFLKATLATSQSHNSEGTKWHGASCLRDSTIWRRLDLLLVPEEEMGAALIYFTGNDIFNRSMRLLASKKGMRLNQKGLYKDVMRGQGREKLTEGTLLEGRDEKRIFEILGVPWRKPEERIC